MNNDEYEQWCKRMLPNIAARARPPTSLHAVEEVQRQFGLFTTNQTAQWNGSGLWW